MIAALVNHLWQSTLFALGAGLLTLALRRNGAGVRYGLWLAASVKFLIPFAWLTAAGGLAVERLHVSLASPHALAAIAPMVAPFPPMPAASLSSALPATAAMAPHAAVAGPHLIAAPFDPALILLGVWALGLAAVLFVWARRWSAIRAALSAARPSRLPAPVPVLSTPIPMEPGVIGLLRPVLIVPEGIADRLSPVEWKAVLAHELCHIRRRDNLTGAMHMLVQALFWFHPLVWWLGVRLVAEREQACDEAVLRDGADAHTYAEGILKVCRLYVQQPLTCAAGVSGADLKQRVQRILAGSLCARLGLSKTTMLAAAAILTVAAPLSAGLFAGTTLAAQAQTLGAPLPLAMKPAAVAAAKPEPEDVERAEPVQTDASAPAQPESAKPIVLAAIETALSPVPEIAPADASARPVTANLSQETPELPAIARAPSEPDPNLAVTKQGQSAPPSASGGSTMTTPKLVPVVLAAAALASSAAAAPTVYVPPGDAPRFGGEFTLTDLGPVSGFWRTECYNWHVRSQRRRAGPFAPPPVDAAIKRFVSGLIVEKPDYDDLSPAMANAVRKNLPANWPSINRMGRATVAKLIDTDKDGNQLYVVDQRGGGSHWNMTINPEGKIASAFMCEGQGL